MPGRGALRPAFVPLRRMRLAGSAGGNSGLHRGNAERRVMPGR